MPAARPPPRRSIAIAAPHFAPHGVRRRRPGGAGGGGLRMTGLWRASRAAVAVLSLVATVGALPGTANAAPIEAASLSADDSATLQRIAAYLNGIHTMTGRFQQTASGGVSSGRVWISRPGRMRFEYDPPNPTVVIADMFYVYYWDNELKQTQTISLRSTPAWFLLRDPVGFTSEIIVTRFEHSGNTVRVSVVETKQPEAGVLTMVFSDNPLLLRQWNVVDQQGKVTTVALHDLQFGMALDPKLFQYQDPFHRQ
jgi:outer membrane lipoprotein-sorting protein